MNFFKTNKILTGVLVLAVFAVLYFALYSLQSTPSLTSSDQVSPVSQQLLVTLSNLHTIKLDGSIFSDPAFQSLTDFGVVIPSQPAGRRNPFTSAASPAPQITTKTTTTGGR